MFVAQELAQTNPKGKKKNKPSAGAGARLKDNQVEEAAYSGEALPSMLGNKSGYTLPNRKNLLLLDDFDFAKHMTLKDVNPNNLDSTVIDEGDTKMMIYALEGSLTWEEFGSGKQSKTSKTKTSSKWKKQVRLHIKKHLLSGHLQACAIVDDSDFEDGEDDDEDCADDDLLMQNRTTL